MRSILALLVLFVSAVVGAQTNYLPAIKWRTLGEGASSQIKKAENHFLYSSGDLQTWWKRHSGDAPQTVPYKVDFNKEFVVAIHVGERKTGGYKVYVETVARTTAASAVIAAVEIQPGKGSVTTDALTQPWVLVAIERLGVQDWQIKTKAVQSLPGRGGSGAGSGGCNCCDDCRRSCGGLKIYNPAPLGIYSSDNSIGIRPLGAVPFLEYSKGDDSDIERQSSFVMQSERQFEEYWAKHRSRDRLIDSGLDWKREQMLAMHLGVVPTTGYKLHIVGIDRTWYGTLNVMYAVEMPNFGDRIQRIATSPYAMVRMSRITEPINFVRRDDLLKNRCECKCGKCGCLH